MADILTVKQHMAKKWNMNTPFEKDNYVLTCTGAQFGASKRTDNPMITFSFEVKSPATFNIAGEEITCAGIPIKFYLVTKTLDADSADGVDSAKTETNEANVKIMYEKCGLDFATFDKENPNVDAF